MDTRVDLLKIKIDRARTQLPKETVQAIDAVPWREIIMGMRIKKGYTFEQLGDLETETELMLCGLLSPEQYPKELATRMQISKNETGKLIEELNEGVFRKIREEMIKITEQKKALSSTPAAQSVNLEQTEREVLKQSGIEVLTDPVLDEMELSPPPIHPELTKKLFEPTQTATVKTEHSVGNLSKARAPIQPNTPKVDPYREPIE